MIHRDLADQVLRAGQFPVVTVRGPRRSGKSTLCRGLFPAKPYANLEADLIVEHADRLTVIEAKAAATASADIFDGSRRVRAHLAAEASTVESLVVCGGAEGQRRTDMTLLPWTTLHTRSWVG